MTILPNPFDPKCGRLAADMADLDYFWAEDEGDLATYTEPERQEERVHYARKDGTYNSTNGHFLCDVCYIKVGMPLGKCP